MNAGKTFELGERRKVTLDVWLSDGQTFTPTDCTWTLGYHTPETVEDTGSSDVEQDGDHWHMTAEIQPKKRREYFLQFTFNFGTEIIKRSVPINVR